MEGFMKTAFVAGATGFTGREVVRLLVGRGIRTVAHLRPDTADISGWRTRLSSMGAEVDETPWEGAAMSATLTRLNPDAVFSLLGTTRARAKAEKARTGSDVNYDRVDYGLTVLLFHAAEKAASGPVFLMLSAAGTGPNPSSAYFRAKWKAEEEVRAGVLRWIIARPSFITGEGRDEKRPLETAGLKLADGALALAGVLGAKALRARYRSTTNGELAAALVKLAADPAAANRIFESEELRDR
jgi:nucleoside-diphosphate-sugar epimerase